jgi:multidrug transporter EmrE-like cation transporter
MDAVGMVVLIELVGDTALKEYAEKGDTMALALGVASYNYMLTWWITALKTRPLAMANAQWDGWSSLLTATYSKFVLREEMTTRQWIGAFSVGLGLLLLGK